MKKLSLITLALVLAVGVGHMIPMPSILAQSNAGGAMSPPTPVNFYTAYPLTPISATAAANAASTLTIPAPTQSGYYNYVCSLSLESSNNNTAAVITNVVTTSTNFNSFAVKFSKISAASNDSGVLTYLNLQAPGCAKSTSPSTATTFVSPTSTNEAYTWTAVYFQAP